jgi:hypothetical protein
MRTLQNAQRTITKAIYGERKYDVNGDICFHVDWYEAEPDLAKLRQAITDTDQRFPWHDARGTGEPLPSIKFLSDGQVVVHNWSVPEKLIWFTIYPPFGMHRGQVYAYEKYLEKISEELARLGLPHISAVHSVIAIKGIGQRFPRES